MNYLDRVKAILDSSKLKELGLSVSVVINQARDGYVLVVKRAEFYRLDPLNHVYASKELERVLLTVNAQGIKCRLAVDDSGTIQPQINLPNR